MRGKHRLSRFTDRLGTYGIGARRTIDYPIRKRSDCVKDKVCFLDVTFTRHLEPYDPKGSILLEYPYQHSIHTTAKLMKVNHLNQSFESGFETPAAVVVQDFFSESVSFQGAARGPLGASVQPKGKRS